MVELHLMAIPSFNSDGNLPIPLHPATLSETLARFGQSTTQRKVVGERLERLYRIAKSTGFLHRFVVFGSFVTSKPEPNDVDVVLIMDDAFDLTGFSGDVSIMFDHAEAQTHFGASVFWSRRFSAFGGEQAMLEYWMICREGGERGIVEIVGE